MLRYSASINVEMAQSSAAFGLEEYFDYFYSFSVIVMFSSMYLPEHNEGINPASRNCIVLKWHDVFNRVLYVPTICYFRNTCTL